MYNRNMQKHVFVTSVISIHNLRIDNLNPIHCDASQIANSTAKAAAIYKSPPKVSILDD